MYVPTWFCIRRMLRALQPSRSLNQWKHNRAPFLGPSDWVTALFSAVLTWSRPSGWISCICSRLVWFRHLTRTRGLSRARLPPPRSHQFRPAWGRIKVRTRSCSVSPPATVWSPVGRELHIMVPGVAFTARCFPAALKCLRTPWTSRAGLPAAAR